MRSSGPGGRSRNAGWASLAAVAPSFDDAPPPLRRRLLVLGSWPAVVGAALSRRARAVSFDEAGTLGVVAASPALAREIGILSDLLVRRLSERSGQRILRLAITIAPGEFAPGSELRVRTRATEGGAEPDRAPPGPEGVSETGRSRIGAPPPVESSMKVSRPNPPHDAGRVSSALDMESGEALAPEAPGRGIRLERLERVRESYLAAARRRGVGR